MSTLAARQDFRVADLSLAPFGRKEMLLAEHEMPGLMAIRKEYGPSKPLEEGPPIGTAAVSSYGSAGTFALPGTYVLVAVFFTAFVLYYFVNWKYLSELWPMS